MLERWSKVWLLNIFVGPNQTIIKRYPSVKYPFAALIVISCHRQGIKSINKQIKLHVDKGCDFRAKVEVDPSLSEAHRSLKEVVRMDIHVFFAAKKW